MKFLDVRNQFKDYCLIERGMTAYNCKAIIRCILQLLAFAETENVKQINETVVRDFLNHLSKERLWAPKTFRIYLQNIKTFFKWCQLRGIVKKNPADKIEKPKLPKRLPRCLTRDQVKTILNHATWYPWRYSFEKIRNETILYTFVLTGIRLQELINLQIYDVNLECGEIMVRQGKGNKDRIVPIHPDLKKILSSYLRAAMKKKNCSKWLFTGIHSGKRLGAKNVQEICRKISISSGIKFTPHMLRHTFARLSVDADLNLYKLKEIMGHSDIVTTQIYLSVSSEGIKKAFNNLRLL